MWTCSRSPAGVVPAVLDLHDDPSSGDRRYMQIHLRSSMEMNSTAPGKLLSIAGAAAL